MAKTTLAFVLSLCFAFYFLGEMRVVLSSSTHSSTNTPLNLTKGWTATWGGSSDDTANRVAVDGLGNIYVAGEFSGTVDFDPDPVQIDIHSSFSNTLDAFVSKFDANGDFLWAKTWGGSKRDVAYGVDVDSSGNVYVVGPYMETVDFNPDPMATDIYTSNAISGSVSMNNIYLSKFAPDGIYQWVRTWGPAYVFGAAGGAEGYNVVVAGNYLYIAGDFSGGTTDFNPWGAHDYHTNHPPASGPIFFDSFLSKFDLNGNFQWAKTWGGEGYDDGPGVAVDGNGNVYIAGMYASQTINFDPASGNGGLGHPAHDSGAIVDVFLSKFDTSGNFQWVKTWGGQGTEDAMGTIIIDSANNVYVSGRFASANCDFNPGGTPDIHSTNGGLDAFLSKFAADGTFQWARTWGSSGSDNATSLGVDTAGNVYVSGWFSAGVDFDPGNGNTSRTANGLEDVFLSQFDASGNFQWVQTWGGSGNDSGLIAVDDTTQNVYAIGEFAGLVDFDPSSGGIDNHTANGGEDAFLSQLLFLPHRIHLPLILRSP